MRRLGRLTLAAGLALASFGMPASTAQARDAVVTSFDGTPIVTHFFPAPGTSGQRRAPTIMLGHGWGGSGATSAPPQYAKAGYNVLTWDARGFGGSGGTVMIDHPEFEARDAQALIDFIALQPEAQLDTPGDPRVGMDGPSYGGGIQFITAARDRRIDAITPTIGWNSLLTSLYKQSAVKLGWATALVGLGIPTSALQGVFSPAGIQTGNQSPQFFSLVTSGTTTGRFQPADVQWLDDHGPKQFLQNITAPTLIVEGTVDTLFTLDEADRNYRALKAEGIPLKMMWFCGGHGACLTDTDTADPLSGLTGDGGLVGKRKLQWFQRWLKGEKSITTGPDFEWIDEGGDWEGSYQYPLREIGQATGTGSGTMPLAPGVNPSGVAVFATPAAPAPPTVTIPVSKPPVGSEAVGEPVLDITYSATGVSLASDGKTHIYAQLIDKQRNLVVNNQASPIPITLDGQTRTISVGMERIASRSTAAGYDLQLIPQTTLYDAQRATGSVDLKSVKVSIPLTAGTDACSNLIRGTKKKDKLKGTAGPDRMIGRAGNDRLKGQASADCLIGGGGSDRLKGGPGDDEIAAVKGGRDKVKCGDGHDRAVVDRRDKVRNCEQVKRVGKKRKK